VLNISNSNLTVFGTLTNALGTPFISASDAINGQYISGVVVNNISQNVNGQYSISCSATGNTSNYTWSLLNVPTTISQTTSSNSVTFSISNTSFGLNCNVNLQVLASVCNISAQSSIVSFCNTITPFINIVNIATSSPVYTTLDNVNYFAPGTFYNIPANGLYFSNLVGTSGYNGNNFLSVNGTYYNWNSIFGGSIISNSGIYNSTQIPNALLMSSNVTINLVNSSTSIPVTVTSNVLFASYSTPVITNSNNVVSGASRVYANGVSIASNEMIYSLVSGNFVSGLSFITNGFYSPSQSAMASGRRRLYLTLTSYTNVPIVSFGVKHNSTLSNITVNWTNINSTWYSAASNWLSGGCGSVVQNVSQSTWYIRRPSSISQTAISVVNLYIDYASNIDVVNPPVII